MDTPQAPVAHTQHGDVRGVQLPGVENYIEIPYGASTAGANRFKPPRPAEDWQGIRDATRWTTRTAQYPDSGVVRTPRQWYAIQGSNYAEGMSEDSLTLNVWTPSSSDGRRRPVLVWIHGGGYWVGHAISEMSDGANFARNHDAIFVSITHRLNAFGFLHLDGIGGPDYAGSGNAGLLDIIAGLEWVKQNIENFGGDPGSVTLVGESGGGGKVSTLLLIQPAWGLFHRAVCESGVAMRGTTIAESEDYARRLISKLGGQDVSILSEASTDELLEAQVALNAEPGYAALGPVIDGVLIPDAPRALHEAGYGADVPVIAGTIHDEVSVFGPTDLAIELDLPSGHPHGVPPDEAPMFDSDAGLVGVARVAGRDVERAVGARRALYPAESDVQLAQALTGDVIFRHPTTLFAEARSASGKPTWVYQLDWASPRLGERGAPHSSAVALFFDNDERVHFTAGLADAHRLSGRMSAALEAFMRTDDPSNDLLPPWPAYRAERRSVMVFDEACRVVDDPDGPIRRAFAEIDPDPLL